MSSDLMNQSSSPTRIDEEENSSVDRHRRLPAGQGQDIRVQDRDNLVKIIIDVKSDTIQRGITNPEDITVIRHAGEGSRPIFDRREIINGRQELYEGNRSRRHDRIETTQSGRTNYGQTDSNFESSDAFNGEQRYSRDIDYSLLTAAPSRANYSLNYVGEREQRYLAARGRCRSYDTTRNHRRSSRCDECNCHRFSRERSVRRMRTSNSSVDNVRKSRKRCSAGRSRRTRSRREEFPRNIDEAFGVYDSRRNTPQFLGYYEVWAGLPLPYHNIVYYDSYEIDSI